MNKFERAESNEAYLHALFNILAPQAEQIRLNNSRKTLFMVFRGGFCVEHLGENQGLVITLNNGVKWVIAEKIGYFDQCREHVLAMETAPC
jgi:hypothetical protein